MIPIIVETIHIVPGANGRALFGYHGYPSFDALYRIVDFNAEGGRPRPAR